MLTKDADYTFDGYFSGEDCTEAQKLTEDQVKATPVGIKLWAKVTGKNGYEGSLKGTFVIKKMALTLKGTQGVTAITKVFGAGDPEETELDKLYAVTSVADFASNDLTDTFDGKITFTRDEGEDAGEYDIIATITDPALAANYSIDSKDIKVKPADAWVQAKFTITPKPINNLGVFADGFTCAPIAPVTYTGNPWTPAISLKDGDIDMVIGPKEPETARNDFYVEYTANTAASTTAKATITGTKNYSGSVTVNFTINAAPVLVKPVVKKVYDGTVTLPAMPAKTDGIGYVKRDSETADGGIFVNKFVFQGLIDGSTPADIIFDNTALEGGAWSTTQKNVTANPVALKFVCAATKDINDVFSLDNYTFIAQDGTLEITQKALTAHADDATINYGAAEVFGLIEDANATTDPDDALTGGLAGDVEALRGAIKVTKAAAAETEGAHAGDYKLKPEWRSDPEIAAVYAAVTSATTKTAKINAAKAARDNYDLTPAFGYLHYNKANLYIGLKESAFTLEKVYDGEEVSLDDQLPKLENTSNLVFSGFQGTDDETKANILNLSELTMAVADNAADADDYTINLSGAKSDFYNIIYIGSTYKIKKKDLKIYIGDQTFVKGQALNMNASLFTIDEEKGLAETDAANEVFKLTTTVVVNNETDKIVTSDPAGNPYQINAVNVGGTDSKWDNYTVTTVNANDPSKTYGIATVLAATAIVLDADADLTNLTGEDETKDATVTFSSRNLKKGVWYTMALPFDITVRQLSNLMGYVVVDKFVANATSSDMNFKIFMGKINAYEPFLIKCDQDVNLNEKNIAVTIKKYADCTDNMTQENASYFFKSNFKKQAIEKAFWTDGPNMTAEQFKFNKYAAGSNLKAMRAYITAKEGVTAAPNIFIEEPDGSTTAISTIDADGVAVEKTGWYTINGVKLEGVPTEKGVYINNGKKIVIK